MGYYYYGHLKRLKAIIKFIIEKQRYLLANKEEREFLSCVPRYCREKCDILYECRDESNHWKCYNGCLLFSEYERKMWKEKYKKRSRQRIACKNTLKNESSLKNIDFHIAHAEAYAGGFA